MMAGGGVSRMGPGQSADGEARDGGYSCGVRSHDLLEYLREERTEPPLRGPSRVEDFRVVERGVLDSCREVGDQAEAQDLETARAGRDGFERRRHSDHVRAHALQHPDFCGCLVVRSR